MDKLTEAWARYRRLSVALGIPDKLIREADAIVSVAESALLDAPAEFNAALSDVIGRVTAAVQDVISRGGVTRNHEVVDAEKGFASFVREMSDARLVEGSSFLGTPRGQACVRFVEWGKAGLNDDAQLARHVLALPRIPTVTRAALDATQAAFAETRMRRLAESILTLVETYYRPVLELVWRLACHASGQGDPEKPENATGKLMSKTKKLWANAPMAVRADDFIYFPANTVRTGAGHPGKMRYDVPAKELVLDLESGIHRLTEPQLLERHGELYRRSRTMHFALLRVSGQEQAVLSPFGSPPTS